MELQDKEMHYGFVRYKLAEIGWTTFKVFIDYPEEDPRKWKIIIGVGLENIDCTYKVNMPNQDGDLKDYFVLCDNGNFLKETVIEADIEELIQFLHRKFREHVPVYPLKKKRKQ